MRKWHLPSPYSPPTPLSYFGWYAQHGSPLPLADVNEVWRAASAGRTCAQSIIKARNSGFIDRTRPIKHVFALHPICWCNANKYIFHLEQTNSPIHKHLKVAAHVVAAQSATKHHGFTKQTTCIRDANAPESPWSALEHCRHSTHACYKGIYFFARVVQAKRGANGSRNAQTSHKRLGAVVTRANGNAQTIEQGAEV